MAYLQVYYKGLLQTEVLLRPEITTIGRAADNDVTIDNAGVSLHHAKIDSKGDRIFIEDLDSTNGIFVNSRRITRKAVGFADEIAIHKYILRVSRAGGQGQSREVTGRSSDPIVRGGTVAVDVSDVEELRKRQQEKKEAYLLLLEAGILRAKYPISRVSFSIGRARDCDLRTSGWLAPRVAANIQRRQDGFYIYPRSRGQVIVNGVRVSSPTRLADGDALSVRGMPLKFFNRPADS
jgi:pSer/pThr/pTyr-binding forkhead associated (FHA) protein